MTAAAGSRSLSLHSLSFLSRPHASFAKGSVVHKLATPLVRVRTFQFQSQFQFQFRTISSSRSNRPTPTQLSPSPSPSSIVSNQDKTKAWHLPPPPPLPATPLARLKHPTRGRGQGQGQGQGQDLRGRYVRLERALRGKEGYEREIEGYEGEKRDLDLDLGVDVDVKTAGKEIEKGKTPLGLVFAGYPIPEAPKPPEPDECCMSGCAVCVHDLYADALEAYESALDSLRAALAARGVPEGSWPAQVRVRDGLRQGGDLGGGGGREGDGEDLTTGRDLGKARRATLSAFEQMELQLAARRTGTQTQDSGSSQKAVQALRSKTIRSDGPSSSLTGKAVMEALSWVLFSRR